MARLTRKNIKVFAGNATNNGVFGSLQAENPVTTTNVEQIQSLPAWSVGWNSATMTSEKLPPLEEFQGIQYVTTYQQAYLMQEGMPEWASTVTYYKGSLTKEVTSNGFRIYCSLTDDNTNHLLSDTSNWKKVMDSSDLYAYDSAVVHIAGTETITGAKTFTAQPQFAPGYGIRFNTDNGSSEHYVMRSSGNPSVGLAMFLNNDISKAAFNISPTKITIGSNTILPNSITPSASDDSTRIATTAWVNAVGNNVVHRSGDEEITGTKTFKASPAVNISQPKFRLQSSTITKGTEPASDTELGWYNFEDNAGRSMGRLRYYYNKDKSSAIQMTAFQANSSGDSNSASIRVVYPASGNPYATAPASDEDGSILITVEEGTANNGWYAKLGNGWMIEQGIVTANNQALTITLPKAFKSATSYSAVGTCNNAKAAYVTTQASSTFTLDASGGIGGTTIRWVAIGKWK